MTGDRERCLAAGMDGYLSKPIDPQMLFAVVEQTGDDGRAAPAGDAARRPRRRPSTRTRCCDRLSGDDELMTDVIARVPRGLPGAARGDQGRGHAPARRGSARRRPTRSRARRQPVRRPACSKPRSVLERIGAESRMDAAEAAGASCRSKRATSSTCCGSLRGTVSTDSAKEPRHAHPDCRRRSHVDDDARAGRLERWGFDVVVAHDGAAAWEQHRRRHAAGAGDRRLDDAGHRRHRAVPPHPRHVAVRRRST